MEEVEKEAELVRKALSGELTSKGECSGREIEVTVDGETFKVEINDPNGPTAAPQFKGRKKKEKAKEESISGSLTAPIPGMIIECKVKVGDEVKVGDTVMVLEAMKMMNNLDAKSAGIVKEIKCKSGDSVAKGDVLLIIEPKA
jgi:biotin carboxyl carrier protein